MSDMEISSILSPPVEPARPSIEQPAQGDHSKDDMTKTTSTMTFDQAATAPAEEPETPKAHEDDHAAESRPQPEQTKAAPHVYNQTTTNNTTTTPTNPTNPTPSPHDQALTIQALRQQLYIAEQHILYFRNEAGRHIWELEHLVRTTWDRSAQLEANVTYLVAELEKANAYNGSLSEHVRALRKDAESRETQYRATLQTATKQQQQASSPSSSSSASAPRKSAAPPLPMQDSSTLLGHNRTTIRSLRTEIRDLKASKNKLQKRLLELSSAPAVDGRAFLQRAGLPREVLSEWSQVLLGKDREIAGLRVIIERERAER